MLKIMAMFQKLAKSVQTSFCELFKHKITYVYLSVLAFILPALFCEWLIIPVIAILLCSSVFLKIEDSIALMFFAYPFFSVFVLKGYNTYNALFAGVCAVLAVRHLIDVFKKQQKLDWLIIGLVAAYLIYVLLPIRKSVTGEFSSNISLEYVASVGVFFALLYLILKQKENINFFKIARMFMIGFLIAGVLGLFAFVSTRLQSVMSLIVYHKFAYMTRFNGLFKLPNTLAIMASVVFAMSLYMLYNKKMNLEAHVYVVGSFALGYVTLARSFLYSAAICFAIFAVAIIVRDKKNCYKTLLPILAEAAIIMLIFFNHSEIHFKRGGMSDLVNGYNDAANSENLDKIADPGRGGLIKKYAKDYLSSAFIVLFGRGLDYPWFGGLSSHNTYLQGFWNTGLVGVALLMVVAFVYLKKFTKMKNVVLLKSIVCDVGLYVLLIPILAVMFIENLFMNMQMIIVVTIVIATIISVKKTEKITQEIQQSEIEENKKI